MISDASSNASISDVIARSCAATGSDAPPVISSTMLENSLTLRLSSAKPFANSGDVTPGKY